MKRTLILLLSIALATPLFAQKIGIREENEELLHIATNYELPKGDIAIALEYLHNKLNNEDSYYLHLYLVSYELPFSFDKGAKALIRTSKGSIIELEQLTNCYDIKREHQLSSARYSTYYYYVFPKYGISRDDMELIINEGIAKIRFETTIGMRDYTYDSDALGKMLKAEFDLIFKKTDFSADF